MPTTIHFNTGRKYTHDGRKITATLYEDGVVTFMDHSRMIAEAFQMEEWDVFNAATVMLYYDHMDYVYDERASRDGMRGVNMEWKG